jgi:hypothetical protein
MPTNFETTFHLAFNIGLFCLLDTDFVERKNRMDYRMEYLTEKCIV